MVKAKASSQLVKVCDEGTRIGMFSEGPLKVGESGVRGEGTPLEAMSVDGLASELERMLEVVELGAEGKPCLMRRLPLEAEESLEVSLREPKPNFDQDLAALEVWSATSELSESVESSLALTGRNWMLARLKEAMDERDSISTEFWRDAASA